MNSLEKKAELIEMSKKELRSNLKEFAGAIENLFKPVFNWTFLDGAIPKNVNSKEVLRVFVSSFPENYIEQWRSLISLADYRDHRCGKRDSEIDERMEKLAFHFIPIARIANQKFAVNASMVFTWIAEAHNHGYCGQGNTDRAQLRLCTDRDYALKTLDAHLEKYLEAFLEKQRLVMEELVYFVDNQQSSMKTKEQRADRRNEGVVKVLYLIARKYAFTN